MCWAMPRLIVSAANAAPWRCSTAARAFRQMDGIRKVGLRQDGVPLARPGGTRISFAGSLLQRRAGKGSGPRRLPWANWSLMCPKWSHRGQRRASSPVVRRFWKRALSSRPMKWRRFHKPVRWSHQSELQLVFQALLLGDIVDDGHRRLPFNSSGRHKSAHRAGCHQPGDARN